MKFSSIILVIMLAGCAEKNIDHKKQGVMPPIEGNLSKTTTLSDQDEPDNRGQKTLSLTPEVAKSKIINNIGELEKKALLGDKEASARLARSMSDDMEQWTRIAIENGNEELAAQYVTYLIGKEPYNCYRALFFAEKAQKYYSEATKEIDKMPLNYLSNLYNETSFQCGCPQEVPGYKYICKNGKGAFERI